MVRVPLSVFQFFLQVTQPVVERFFIFQSPVRRVKQMKVHPALVGIARSHLVVFELQRFELCLA